MAIEQAEFIRSKPWGQEVVWAFTTQYLGKILMIHKGHRLSLQYHEHKEETIRIASGKLLLLLEDDNGRMQEIQMMPGDVQHIRPGRKHRMIALEETEVLEVSTSQIDDVVRLEDSYGRCAENSP